MFCLFPFSNDLGMEEENYKMSLEHLVVPGNTELLKKKVHIECRNHLEVVTSGQI